MRAARRPTQPRRRRPRDPRIGHAAIAADAAATAAASPRHLATPRTTTDAPTQQQAAAWWASAPPVTDAHGQIPTKRTHRFFGRGVTTSQRTPQPRTAPVSIQAR